ncbi:MAG: redoxin domain-containing protein, partial [Chloroflexota bacterium]|nr:redoxin domain-containing protein [Chloroflexota bacterium]
FERLPIVEPADEYNYDHFRARHLFLDIRRGIENQGIMPGEVAPDFELPQADGGSLRLSDLRGRPALLHFGSFT